MLARKFAAVKPAPKSVSTSGSITDAATESATVPAPKQVIELAELLSAICWPTATGIREENVLSVLTVTGRSVSLATTVRWPGVAEGPRMTSRTDPTVAFALADQLVMIPALGAT
jgi:hypothetical protein